LQAVPTGISSMASVAANAATDLLRSMADAGKEQRGCQPPP